MERLVHASLFAVIFGAAWTYGNTKPAHRTIALLFAWVLLADMARLAIDPVLDSAAPDYPGSTRLLYYVDHALVLSFHFALLAACARRFARASLRLPIGAFGVTLAVVVVMKEATGVSLVIVHHWVAGIVTGACWILVIREILAPASRLRAPDGTHAVLLVLLAERLVNVALHYIGPLQDTWVDVRRADLVVHGGIAAGYAVALVRIGVRRWRALRS